MTPREVRGGNFSDAHLRSAPAKRQTLLRFNLRRPAFRSSLVSGRRGRCRLRSDLQPVAPRRSPRVRCCGRGAKDQKLGGGFQRGVKTKTGLFHAIHDLIPVSTSIRNRLPGKVEKIVSDKVVSEIVINTAAGTVTSIITTGSVKRMNLKRGDSVFAVIKATEVSV